MPNCLPTFSGGKRCPEYFPPSSISRTFPSSIPPPKVKVCSRSRAYRQNRFGKLFSSFPFAHTQTRLLYVRMKSSAEGKTTGRGGRRPPPYPHRKLFCPSQARDDDLPTNMLLYRSKRTQGMSNSAFDLGLYCTYSNKLTVGTVKPYLKRIFVASLEFQSP